MPPEDPRAELDRLASRRIEATERVRGIEQDARAAAADLQAAQHALIQAERGDATAAERKRLETALGAAKTRAAEPWGERRLGAEAAARDRHAEEASFAREHLDALAHLIEEDGDRAALALADGAARCQSAYADWQHTAGELSALLALAGRRVNPGDITGTVASADNLARAAYELALAGGQPGPRLRVHAEALRA